MYTLLTSLSTWLLSALFTTFLFRPVLFRSDWLEPSLVKPSLLSPSLWGPFFGWTSMILAISNACWSVIRPSWLTYPSAEKGNPFLSRFWNPLSWNGLMGSVFGSLWNNLIRWRIPLIISWKAGPFVYSGSNWKNKVLYNTSPYLSPS